MKSKYVTPALFSFIALGPVGWFFIDLSSGRYDRLAFLYVATIVAAVVATLMWANAVKQKSE